MPTGGPTTMWGGEKDAPPIPWNDVERRLREAITYWLVVDGAVSRPVWGAWLDDELWLRNARHANAMAARLASGLATVAGVTFVDAVEANLLFVRLPDAVARGLRQRGFHFYPDRRDPAAVRLVTSFRTSAQAVDDFIAHAVDLSTSGT